MISKQIRSFCKPRVLLVSNPTGDESRQQAFETAEESICKRRKVAVIVRNGH